MTSTRRSAAWRRGRLHISWPMTILTATPPTTRRSTLFQGALEVRKVKGSDNIPLLHPVPLLEVHRLAYDYFDRYPTNDPEIDAIIAAHDHGEGSGEMYDAWQDIVNELAGKVG